MGRRSLTDAVAGAWSRARSVFALAVGVLATFFVCIALVGLGRFRPQSPLIERVLAVFGHSWLAPAGVRVTAEGLDRIDPQRSYVVVSNHLSNLDIMAILAASPLSLRFMAKRELFRIPLFGQAIRAIGMIEVDRTRANFSAIRRQAAATLRAGRSVAVFPEGTRSRDGEPGEFKRGAFVVAIADSAPVCPLTIEGSRACWAPGSWRINPGTIRVVVGDPIETHGLRVADAATLSDAARD